MRTVAIVIVISFLMLGEAVLADRVLSRDEILQIFETLTSTPRKTWIPSGVITAEHYEYKAPRTTDTNEVKQTASRELQEYLQNPNKLELNESLRQMKAEAIPFNANYRLTNKHSMASDVTIKFDGQRFYWQISVLSRTDSVQLPAELRNNPYTEEFKLFWNQNRVFTWDGEKYVNYFRPGNHATIESIPSGINGPLTAGIIPWGYGRYSYSVLSKAKFSATQVDTNEGAEVHFEIIRPDRQETFVMDTLKNYAIKSYSSVEDNLRKVHAYKNYILVANNWCPLDIEIEHYDITGPKAVLKSQDKWTVTDISNGTPPQSSFVVDFEYDAFIEDFRFGKEPFQYRYLPPEPPSVKSTELDELIRIRQDVMSASAKSAQNCATACLKYACKKLGSDICWEELSGLVHGDEKTTTMLEMAQFIQDNGLYAVAVNTDLVSLKDLKNYVAILYLPQENHYVVLHNFDNQYVRVIDLTENNIYYRMNAENLKSVWKGIALVLSHQPLTAAVKHISQIDSERLHKIIGAATCEACNTTIQEAADFGCSSALGLCGAHMVYYKRKGCGPASSGTCPTSPMPAYKWEPCIENEDLECVGNGEWHDGGSITACG